MLRERTRIDIIQNKNSFIHNPLTGENTPRVNTISIDFIKEWDYSSSWENLSSTGKVSFPKNINIRFYPSDHILIGDPDYWTDTQQLIYNKQKSIAGKTSISNLFRRGDAIIIKSYYEYWEDVFEEKVDENGKKIIQHYLKLTDTRGETYEPWEKIIVDGYITNVKSDSLIEIEFEDSMFLLKQIPMPNYTFPKNTDIRKKLIDIIKDGLENMNKSGNGINTSRNEDGIIIVGSGNNISNNGEQSVFISGGVNNEGGETISFDGPIVTTEHETVAQFLARLKKDMFVKCFFRNDVNRIINGYYVPMLYITFFPYNYNSEKKIDIKGRFIFQDNIISNDLKYRLKSDINLSAICDNYITEDTGKTNKDGTKKIKKKRIEVLIYQKVAGSEEFDYKVIEKGQPIPENTGGERRKFTFVNAKTIDDLVRLGKAQLMLYYYNGFSGKFTTFGEPHINEGDVISLENPPLKLLGIQNGNEKTESSVFVNDGSVQIYDIDTNPINPVLIDRQGYYFVKKVDYSGGINGFRQEIELDFKLLEKNQPK